MKMNPGQIGVAPACWKPTSTHFSLAVCIFLIAWNSFFLTVYPLLLPSFMGGVTRLLFLW